MSASHSSVPKTMAITPPMSLPRGDGITAVYGAGAYGGALAAYALGIGGLRYGGGIEAVYYNTLRRGG